jgi:phage terminase small subunit
MDSRAGKLEITQERVLEEFATAAFLNPKEMFREDGRLLPIHDMSDRAARAITSFEVEEIFEGVGEDRIWIGYLKKVKLVSKEGTLNSTARHLGMFNDKLSIAVDDKRVEKLQAAQARAEKLRGKK